MHGRALHEVPAFQRRLDRQADESRPHRRALYARAGLGQARIVLDVGCGSGAVTADLQEACGGRVVAVDVDASMARRTREAAPSAAVLRADGHRLPLRDGSVDAAACNLTLMWARDPVALVAEMARVVRPGGTVLASMEPDYGGKVHHPENPLIDLVFQGEGVRRRGGDPHAGRKLRSHFVAAGLRAEVGIATPQVLTPEQDLAVFRRNRAYYRALLGDAGFAAAAIDSWESEYLESLSAGQQLSFLPVFYAIGRKPVPGDIDAA
ncbi:MAG TPA: methyltransferase domain-containing protein [Candidatus Thermoplasmatota archaeon]|nr:methyltransferase domain-containing protein [Candidatus Thermoplasmatota archaeon]